MSTTTMSFIRALDAYKPILILSAGLYAAVTLGLLAA